MAEIINTLTIIFVVSSITLFLAKRKNHPAIPAYIIAGLISGYFITEQEQLFTLVQLGIAFLVFLFGLKFDPEKIKDVAVDSQIATLIQVSCLGSIGFITGIIAGLDIFHSSIFALAAALSSSLVGIELLEKEIDFRLIHGRIAESINLIQDLIAILAIIVLSSAAFDIGTISTTLTYGISILAVAFLIREYLMSFIAKQAQNSTELLMLISITILTGFIALSEFLELSIVVGSFAAGISVAKYPYNLEILDTVSSLKDFFSAIFFVTLGALITLPNLNVVFLTVLLVILTVIIQPYLMSLILTHLGYDARTSFATATSIDQISELVLILVIQLYLVGSIIDEVFQAVILAAIITMITSSYTTRHEQKLFNIMNRYDLPLTQNPAQKINIKQKLEDHVIVLGYDIQGKRITELLEEKNEKYIIIENDPEKIDEIKKKGHNYIYGNALHTELWNQAEYKRAKLIISTPPFKQISKKIAKLETNADKILTASELDTAHELLEKDNIIYVNVPEITSIDQVTEHLIGTLNDVNYKEELRRKNMLEVRKYLDSEEG